jgi:hypothetical protein
MWISDERNPRGYDRGMSETPPIDAFLHDPEFSTFVEGRVSAIRTQTLARMKTLALPEVDVETGAKILAHYAFVPREDVDEPGRPMGRHDMKGSGVWHARDPLYANGDAVVRAVALERAIADLWDGSRPKYRTIFDVLLLADKSILDDENYARPLLDVDGFHWIHLSDRLKGDAGIAAYAIERSDSVAEFMEREKKRKSRPADDGLENVDI